MIVTEPGLTWRRSFEARGPHGEECIRYDCVEHPRLYQLRQRPSDDVDALLRDTSERIGVLADPEKAAAHLAVLQELIVSKPRIDAFLAPDSASVEGNKC